MKITISAHAAQRAAERGISEEGIRAILDGNTFVLRPSKSDPEVFIVLDIFEDKMWAVILNYSTSNVITVRRARKNERIYYEKKGN